MADNGALELAISNLVIANRILAREGIIDGFGHVSSRHPSNPERFLLSRSRSPEIITRDDIMEFELDGTLVGEDNRRPYAERYIHGAIYMERPDINAISHHHAGPVIPFTVCDKPLRPVFNMASVIGDQVPVWDSADEFGDTDLLISSLEMGQSLARALGEGRAVLLRGHGAVCAAHDLRGLCMVSIFMRDNADHVLKALRLSEPAYLSKGEVERTSAMLLSEMPMARAWEYWTARAGFSGL